MPDSIVFPDDLSGLSNEDLSGLESSAVERFNTLNANDNVEDETLEEMASLADGRDRVRAEIASRQRRQDLATRMQTTAASDPEPITPEPVAPVVVIEPVVEPDPVPAVVASANVTPTTVIPEVNTAQLVITAAADIPSISSGSQMNLETVAHAMHLKARTLSDHSGYVPIASADKVFELGYDLTDIPRAQQWEAIMDNSGAAALTASGGWCAPSEILYDFFDIECQRGSVIQLPTFKANRGGVTWPVSSPLPPVFLDGGNSATDWVWTETTDITPGSNTKPCITVPCPTFDECRLDAHGICVTAGNLMDRAYPENLRRYLNQVFIAHERNENLRKIAVLTGGSIATVFGATFGAASALINAVLLQAAQYRDQFRMCDGAQLEAVFPLWVREVIRGDLARQEGSLAGDVSGLPSNAQINGWFNESGITIQFVNDWQALTDGNDWPGSVDFLLYAPGTWVEFNGGTLDLGVVRDSVLNATNDYTAAWMEEFYCIGFRGYESRLVTVPICADGAVGARQDITCPTATS